MNRRMSYLLLVVAAACFLYAFESFQRSRVLAPRPPVGQAPGALPVSGTVMVAVLDVGQGDAILIRSPEGKTALIDAGPSHDVVQTLRDERVTALDLVVVSHHHADHYGGMAEVVRAFHPRVFLASNSSHTSAHYLKLLELVRDQGIQAIAPGPSSRTISLGSVTLTVFPQAPEDPHEENNNSVGIRLQYGKFSVLLPGDAETAERALWERTVPDLIADCTVLKLAHHGSRNGTDLPWLRLVNPELAVVSLGAGNEYGHPHAETLALLADRKIPLLRTDLEGTIELTSDGSTWHVASHPGPTHTPRTPHAPRTRIRTPHRTPASHAAGR